MEVQGKRGPDKWLPHLLGHEGSGVVLKTGRGVKKVKEGDHVVLGWIKGFGMDVGGPAYRWGRQKINAGPITTFSTLTIVSENRCVRIPKKAPLDVAALLGCALMTGAGMVIHEIQPWPGSSVAIFGLGGIGFSALLALQFFGCSMVVVVDPDRRKTRLARRFGATHALHDRETAVVDRIRNLTKGQGVDFSIDATGDSAGIESAFASVRRNGGLCTFASHPPLGSAIRLDPYELICGKRIQGSWGGGADPDQDVSKMLRLLTSRDLPVGALISHRFPLCRINDAFKLLQSGCATRIVVTMPEGSRNKKPTLFPSVE